MGKIIDGKKIAERVKDGIAQEVHSFMGERPNLSIILVGDREDSKLYVSLKEKEGKKVGIDTHLYLLEQNSKEEDILEIIKYLNKDDLIDGILIQLPLPKHINTDKIIEAINPEKDVDGFHPQKPDYIISPVLASVEACLEDVKIQGEGNKACCLYHSSVFGKGLKELLEKRGFEICDEKNSSQADLLICAKGEPLSIKKEAVKEGAVIVDIGITKKDDKVYGDVDFESVKDKVSYITPVPGGIGPMTIAFLFKNVLAVYKKRKNNQ